MSVLRAVSALKQRDCRSRLREHRGLCQCMCERLLAVVQLRISLPRRCRSRWADPSLKTFDPSVKTFVCELQIHHRVSGDA
jgi:hypothetical protein